MTRLTCTRNWLAKPLQAVAARLIGFGGLVVLMPLLFVRSPLSLAMRAFAPFGWVALLIGFGLLTLELRQHARIPPAGKRVSR